MGKRLEPKVLLTTCQSTCNGTQCDYKYGHKGKHGAYTGWHGRDFVEWL